MMPYIPVEKHLPGITGLLEYRRDSAEPIRHLTQELLRGPSSLTQLERELVAVVVSHGNECRFCTTAHAAAADLLSGYEGIAAQVMTDIATAQISSKMRALLSIAILVRESGKLVTAQEINRAKEAGATDMEIHDTVLIAALFCLYNRYVDGLATDLPQHSTYFEVLAGRLVDHGYIRLPQGYDHLKQT